ncbi:MAG: helix-turn-helix domain-containing protein [Oscillospiraceae bacterium]|nr:helix-turn-helix domain-containing protein [Oscillospiraceae bacterium]
MASEEKQLKWFGRRLSLARKERGLSQAQLAKRLYVGQATVSRLEQGTAVPDVATIRQIAEVLDVDVNLLMSDAADSATAITVEDNRFLMRRYLTVLEQALPNARCYGFERATEALKFAHSNKVDIAFLDIELFDADGMELAARLAGLNPKINIIYLTCHPEYTQKALDTFCSGYVLKPLTPEKIMTQIAHLRFPILGLSG